MNRDAIDKCKRGQQIAGDFEAILATEYSGRFDDIRKKMMVMSFYKYGPLKQNYGTFKCMDAIGNLKKRLNKYEETGNTEYLCDVANFAMLEFMHPSHPSAAYGPTDDPNCELVGFSVNELYKEE